MKLIYLIIILLLSIYICKSNDNITNTIPLCPNNYKDNLNICESSNGVIYQKEIYKLQNFTMYNCYKKNNNNKEYICNGGKLCDKNSTNCFSYSEFCESNNIIEPFTNENSCAYLKRYCEQNLQSPLLYAEIDNYYNSKSQIFLCSNCNSEGNLIALPVNNRRSPLSGYSSYIILGIGILLIVFTYLIADSDVTFGAILTRKKPGESLKFFLIRTSFIYDALACTDESGIGQEWDIALLLFSIIGAFVVTVLDLNVFDKEHCHFSVDLVNGNTTREFTSTKDFSFEPLTDSLSLLLNLVSAFMFDRGTKIFIKSFIIEDKLKLVYILCLIYLVLLGISLLLAYLFIGDEYKLVVLFSEFGLILIVQFAVDLNFNLMKYYCLPAEKENKNEQSNGNQIVNVSI